MPTIFFCCWYNSVILTTLTHTATIICFFPVLVLPISFLHVMDFFCCSQVTLVKMVNEATASIPNWDSYAAGWAFTDLASQFSLPNVSMVVLVHDHCRTCKRGGWQPWDKWYTGLAGYRYRLLTFLPEFSWQCSGAEPLVRLFCQTHARWHCPLCQTHALICETVICEYLAGIKKKKPL